MEGELQMKRTMLEFNRIFPFLSEVNLFRSSQQIAEQSVCNTHVCSPDDGHDQ